jgi:uncharacterized protein (DUF433 family)
MATNRTYSRQSGNRRPRPHVLDVPAYTVGEASHYLVIPEATLRSWVKGRNYPLKPNRSGFFRPIIQVPDERKGLLSFTNLVEAHVLDAIRREHGVQLRKVRDAIRYMEDRLQASHPLATQSMVTDGIDLFVQRYADLINVSREGQLAMSAILNAYLRRVDWDNSGFAIRLYPFTRKRALDEPKVVVIDPEVSFGKPILVGTGIPTSTVAERYKAGESVDELAQDYDLKRAQIEEAIRCELSAA